MKKNSDKKKVIAHLKGDIKTFHKEAKEDKELMKKLGHSKKVGHYESAEPMRGLSHKEHMEKEKKKKKHKAKKKDGKVSKVMHEFGAGELHSGSKKGPVVANRKQAVAIALSEARKAGEKVKPAKKHKKK